MRFGCELKLTVALNYLIRLTQYVTIFTSDKHFFGWLRQNIHKRKLFGIVAYCKLIFNSFTYPVFIFVPEIPAHNNHIIELFKSVGI